MATSGARIVIAYDGSTSAATAVRAATRLFGSARAFIATVPDHPTVGVGTAMPMVPGVSTPAFQRMIDEVDAEARREAEELARRAVELARQDGLEAEVATVPSATPAWSGLLDAARRVEADVLVCGTRGRGAFARALLGSTASSLLHNADVPLLVVPDGAGALDGPVIVAYDGSEGARRAIEVAGRVLRGRRAVVVHAWEPVFRRELTARALAAGPVDDIREMADGLHRALAEAADARTQEGVDAARAAGLEAVGEPVESDDRAWRAVAAAAQAHGASVIVVGTRGLGAARSALLGSVSSALIQNAELPILVVPDAPGES
jgi:nucleotide-binding universal stress UspA family protein